MDEANEAYEERLEDARRQRRVEEAKRDKDAERYRWLRDKCNHVRVGVHIQFSSNERDADAAIDAAMNGANY